MIFAVVISIIVLVLLAVFQALLIAGLPIGRFAWGGQHRTLPRKLRISSAVSVGLYVLFALLILSKAAYWQVIPQGILLDISLWVMFTYSAIGVVMNALSRSKPERYTMTLAALVLAVCFFVIASS